MEASSTTSKNEFGNQGKNCNLGSETINTSQFKIIDFVIFSSALLIALVIFLRADTNYWYVRGTIIDSEGVKDKVSFDDRAVVAPEPESSTNSHVSEQRKVLACPVFPVPPPLPGKKGAARVLNPSGQNGSWEENLPKVISLDAYWNYNWSPNRIDQQPTNMEFMPMSWGGRNNASQLKSYLDAALFPQINNSLVKRLAGFNEPDHPLQSNMSVAAALDRWPVLESYGLPLVSPSCAHCDKLWIEQFMGNATAACMRIDYLGVHWYGSANFTQFKSFMSKLNQKFRKPILITEFAPADWTATTNEKNQWSQAKVLAFAKKALPWLESTTWIAGYAWYSFQPTEAYGWSSSLFDMNGNLTRLGEYYKSVRINNTNGNQSITV